MRRESAPERQPQSHRLRELAENRDQQESRVLPRDRRELAGIRIGRASSSIEARRSQRRRARGAIRRHSHHHHSRRRPRGAPHQMRPRSRAQDVSQAASSTRARPPPEKTARLIRLPVAGPGFPSHDAGMGKGKAGFAQHPAPPFRSPLPVGGRERDICPVRVALNVGQGQIMHLEIVAPKVNEAAIPVRTFVFQASPYTSPIFGPGLRRGPRAPLARGRAA
jgi:hypothetical protein